LEDPFVVAAEYTVAELDAKDLDDPSMCAEYAKDIFEYYKDLELQTLPNAEYMDYQDDLDCHKRVSS
jgi:hypothetical protein